MAPTDPRKKWAEFLANHKLRATVSRRSVLEAIAQSPGHFDAETLRLRLKGQGRRLSRATIYRTLALLSGSGIVRRGQSGAGAVFYKVARPDEPRHDLVCRRCGGVQDLPDAAVSRGLLELARRAGFEPDEASARIQGVCARCRAARRRQGPQGPGNTKP